MFVPGAERAVTLNPGDIIIGAAISASDVGLMVVDPTTGNRTILSDNTHGTGVDFSDPTGVSFASDGSLLVPETVNHTLFRVDPATADRAIISSTNTSHPVGTGPTSDFIGARQFGNEIAGSVNSQWQQEARILRRGCDSRAVFAAGR
jgi:hypothetical protein